MSDSIFDQSRNRLGSLASQIHARRHKAMTADELDIERVPADDPTQGKAGDDTVIPRRRSCKVRPCQHQ